MKDSKEQLRYKAEMKLKQEAGFDINLPEDTRKLIYELQIHHEELKMQNEQLLMTQADLDKSRAKYFNLFEFAPIGYFTIDRNGMIHEVNQCGAKMLGLEKKQIINRGFSQYIAKNYQDVFYDHRKLLFKKKTRQSCELLLINQSGAPLNVRMESIPLESETDGKGKFLSAVIDISVLKEITQKLKKSEKRLRQLSTDLLNSQENERKHVAQEIHDGINPLLTGMKFGIEKTLAQLSRNDITNLQQTLEHLMSVNNIALEEAERIHVKLWPSLMETMGLIAAIEWFCEEYKHLITGIQIHTEFNLNEAMIPENLKIVIYRITQEAFQNSTKHSQAKNISIRLMSFDGCLQLEISDDGNGFDLSEALIEEGSGIRNMEQRTELSGGKFSIDSVPGKGTRISASWAL